MAKKESLTMAQRVSMLKSSSSSTGDSSTSTVKNRLKRANKNCPSEVTSKKPVPRLRQVIVVANNHRRDPRFGDSSCTKFSADRFEKSYDFLNDWKASEINDLSTKIRKTKDADLRKELTMELASMKRDVADKKRSAKIAEIKRAQKQEEKKAVAAGKTPFYLKKSAKKTLELRAKYEELKESGKLNNFITKKRKKNASKDHRWLPTARKI